MSKKLFAIVTANLFAVLFMSAVGSSAQTRNAVSVSEVTGTFRSYFTGKAKGSYDEIKIASAGRGKLKVSFELMYPHLDSSGQMMPNMGSAQGDAVIDGSSAFYTSTDFGQCKITIDFVKPGQIKVTQSGSDVECGFGANVTADGTYKKVSGAKPKFEAAGK